MNPDKSIKQRVLSFLRKGGVVAGVAALCSGATYLFTQHAYESEIAELQELVSDLRQKELEAKVTQRVSEQMEDIAFQQKTISDKQREEAIKMSKIADMERGKAEIERGLAQKAQKQAMEAAHQADYMRQLAEDQTRLATENLLAAQTAKAKADTLFYLSLGNSLAQSSITKGEADPDLSRLLSYASWHFTKNYGGDVNTYNIYKSVLLSSNTIESMASSLKGNVRRIEMARIDGKVWPLGVTDYGEVFLYNERKESRLFHVSNAPMRSMCMVSDDLCATVTSDGRVMLMQFSDGTDPKMRIAKDIRLDKGLWKNICLFDHETLALLSNSSLIWLDAKSLSVKGEVALHSGLTTFGMEPSGLLHIFGDNGLHYMTSRVGECKREDLKTVPEKVTKYYYNRESRYHVLGTESGTLYIFSHEGKPISRLTGHTGAITDLLSRDNIIISASYDHTMRFWLVGNKDAIAESIDISFTEWPLTFNHNAESEMIWIGSEGGKITRFCTSTAKNAEAIKSQLHREFSPLEWNYYIGPSVPYRTFKKGGNE